MSLSNNTKNALAKAMKTLMVRQSFTKISVGDICDECGLNRKSFYYHFKDKYDLVNWIFQTEFLEMLKVHTYSSSWQLILDICVYLYSEKEFYSNALQYEGQNSFRGYFSSTIGAILLVLMNENMRNIEDSRFFVTFTTDAILAAIIRWLTESPSTKPEEFVGKLQNAIRAML